MGQCTLRMWLGLWWNTGNQVLSNHNNYPMAPDFVMELRSASDGLVMLQAKMQEYLAHGVGLGWLIAPGNQGVEIYQTGNSVEVLEAPSTVIALALLFCK